ncbi:MAG: cation:proton antiporter [Christensenellales bacterium]|jgi:Kef-type K+ transport system membrane component KefB|nr:cation:proton antiporter [Clostridiales bacterium]
MNALLSLTLAMIGGLILSRIVKVLHLPNVTGYLVAGIIVGPYVCNFVSLENIREFSTILTAALGFIAFSIGSEFKLANIKRIGNKAVIITLFESLTAVLAVLGGLYLLKIFFPDKFSTPVILILSAVAAATAPAATLMVVRQYKAKGPVTDILLPVVAFDDAISLIVFSINFALAKVFATNTKFTVITAFLYPLLEIVLSLAIGGAIGALLALCMKFFKSRANRLCLMIAAVFGGIAVSEILKLSTLLTCMMIGAMFTNLRKDSSKILEGSERWTPPLFMLFFVVSGASLDFSILPYVGIAGVAYIVFRSLGKYWGAVTGALTTKADKNIRKYLGIALLPQAGVAIGMSQMVAAEPKLAEYAPQVVTIILCATLVYELIGPILTKIALVKAGEVVESEETKALFLKIFKKKNQNT